MTIYPKTGLPVVLWQSLTSKNALFFFIWTLFFAVFVFRIDSWCLDLFDVNAHLLTIVGPFSFILLSGALVFKQKWFYTLKLLFYPIVIVFWILPKWALRLGKLYALLHYLEFLFNKLRNFRHTMIVFTVTVITFTTFLLTNNDGIRILAITLASYFFFGQLVGYIKKSFQPTKIFGVSLETFQTKKLTTLPDTLIEALENVKDDEKVNEEGKKFKKLERLILVNFCMGYLSDRLSSFRGKRAYMQFAIMQLGWYMLAGIVYFTFVNYQLYQIEATHYLYAEAPGIFDFFYYSLKNMTFSNPDFPKPSSTMAMVIELTAFFIFSILFFIIIASHLITLRSDKVNESLMIAASGFRKHSEAIELHVSRRYNRDIGDVVNEMATIKKSLDKLRRLFDQFI